MSEGQWTVIIRPAVETDQQAIKAIVWAALINPLDLEWPRFLVAVDGGRIVGVGQVKPHWDGTRELASLAVVPDRREQGIGRAIIEALLAREERPIYLMCTSELEPYYARFGFQRLEADQLPPSFRLIHRIGNLYLRVRSIIARDGLRLIVMRQEG